MNFVKRLTGGSGRGDISSDSAFGSGGGGGGGLGDVFPIVLKWFLAVAAGATEAWKTGVT